MFPHPETVCHLQNVRNGDLLGVAAQARLIDEERRGASAVSSVGGLRASARRILASLAVAALGFGAGKRAAA